MFQLLKGNIWSGKCAWLLWPGATQSTHHERRQNGKQLSPSTETWNNHRFLPNDGYLYQCCTERQFSKRTSGDITENDATVRSIMYAQWVRFSFALPFESKPVETLRKKFSWRAGKNALHRDRHPRTWTRVNQLASAVAPQRTPRSDSLGPCAVMSRYHLSFCYSCAQFPHCGRMPFALLHTYVWSGLRLQDWPTCIRGHLSDVTWCFVSEWASEFNIGLAGWSPPFKRRWLPGWQHYERSGIRLSFQDQRWSISLRDLTTHVICSSVLLCIATQLWNSGVGNSVFVQSEHTPICAI